MNKVQETLGYITGDDDGVSVCGLWKAKQKILPNDKVTTQLLLKTIKAIS